MTRALIRRALATALLLSFGATLASAAPRRPLPVKEVRDLAYVEGLKVVGNKHRLDLYLPQGVKKFPVFMFIHGGAWKAGDRAPYAFIGLTLARNGIGCAAISYRLSPGVKHPAHIQDCAQAFHWLRTHVGEYGGNPAQLYVGGHSAGGHLAALLATNAAYLKAVGESPKAIKGCVGISGVYRITASRFFDSIFGQDAATLRDASPVEHVKAAAAPFLLLYGEKDLPGLPAGARAFAARLKAAGKTVRAQEFAGRTHGTIIRQIGKPGDTVTQAILRFIAAHAGLDLRDDAGAASR